MNKSRHAEARIIGALKQVEAGRTAENIAREQGFALAEDISIRTSAASFNRNPPQLHPGSPLP
jgi:hypothetical protein